MEKLGQDSHVALEDLMYYDENEWVEWVEDYVDDYQLEYHGEKEEDEVVQENGDREIKDIERTSLQESDPDFGAVQDEKRRESILRRKAEKESEALKKLIDGSRKEKQTASVETIITFEDEIQTASFTSSSSSNFYSSLEDIDIDDSQLQLQNLFNAYPAPDDPGNVRAFWVLYDPIPIYQNDGIKRFADAMKALHLKPIACMSDLLRSDIINLRYYGLDPRAVKPICESIYDNTSVQSLDLKDNWLTPDPCIHLNNLLLESEILASVKLGGCRIGCEGIRNMLQGLVDSWTLFELDLSRCRLGNEGSNLLASVIENHETLQILNLADNQLGAECAAALQSMLTNNNHLLKLNLSWNGFSNKESSNALFKGLLENKTLVSVDLSWNALAKESLGPLGTFLQGNRTLVGLNLSGNRFDEQAGIAIAKSLAKNIGLQELYLGNNPLRAAGGSAIVHALIPGESPNTSLRSVNLENVWVNKDVLQDLEKIGSDRPWLEVKLGGILSNFKLVGPDEKKIFFKRAIFEGNKPKKLKQRRDFGHFILSLEDKLNTKENFKQLIKLFKIKLSETLVNALMNAFPGENKKVDQTAMKALYLQQYPDTTSPPQPTLKKKKEKQEKKKQRADTKKRKKGNNDVAEETNDLEMEKPNDQTDV